MLGPGSDEDTTLPSWGEEGGGVIPDTETISAVLPFYFSGEGRLSLTCFPLGVQQVDDHLF